MIQKYVALQYYINIFLKNLFKRKFILKLFKFDIQTPNIGYMFVGSYIA